MSHVHDLIVQYLDENDIVSHEPLQTYIEENFLVREAEANKAISEAIQANLIRRYEYTLSDTPHVRRIFYMRADSRLMF